MALALVLFCNARPVPGVPERSALSHQSNPLADIRSAFKLAKNHTLKSRDRQRLYGMIQHNYEFSTFPPPSRLSMLKMQGGSNRQAVEPNFRYVLVYPGCDLSVGAFSISPMPEYPPGLLPVRNYGREGSMSELRG